MNNVERLCKFCDKILNNKQDSFCSKECFNFFKLKYKVTYICLSCGKEIINKAHTSPKFCSNYCYVKYPKSECTRTKLSISNTGKTLSKEHVEKISAANKGRKLTVESKNKMRAGQIKRIEFEKEKGIVRKHTVESKKKMSVIQKALNKKISYHVIEKIKLANTGRKKTPEELKKLSISSKQRWENPVTKDKMLSAMRTDEHKEKCHQRAINQWNNPDFISKQHSSSVAHPNKAERQLDVILDEYFPDSWSYTGDFGFMINGKNPDFVNINGENKVIEFFGEYWHEKSDEQERINYFKQYKYETLIIWEHELKDKQALVLKLLPFCNGGL